MGRGKLEMKRIENKRSRQVTFSKRKNGILKKAYELSVLCDAEVATIIISPSGRFYEFATDGMERIIARYRNEVGLPRSTHQELRTVEVESWKSEIAELEKSINILETRLRHFTGEDISNLGVNELKQLERQLKIGMDRILSKKETDLQEENLLLQQRVRTEKLLIFYESGAWSLFSSKCWQRMQLKKVGVGEADRCWWSGGGDDVGRRRGGR
ncbi:hypothetical protein Q3G72_000051 [Acer saccharum]|nr:hypothetical protein Q3G72_000051 [Acer saccharum]